MNTSHPIELKDHPEYENTIDEVVKKKFDKSLMNEALKISVRESRAEALYVLLKLKK